MLQITLRQGRIVNIFWCVSTLQDVGQDAPDHAAAGGQKESMVSEAVWGQDVGQHAPDHAAAGVPERGAYHLRKQRQQQRLGTPMHTIPPACKLNTAKADLSAAA